MSIDLPPVDAGLWLPPKPAIIRPWKDTIAKLDTPKFESSFPFPSFCPGAAAVAPATVSRNYNQATGTTGLTPSITGVSFNTAHANRIIVFAFGWNGLGSNTFSSATIAGVSATLAADGSAFATSLRFVIFYAPVPTGTSGTVAITLTGSGASGHVGVSWSVVYVNSGTHIAAAATSVASGAISVNVNTLANSVVCGVGKGAQVRTATGILANYSNPVSGNHNGHNSLVAAATPSAAGISGSGGNAGSFGAVTFS